MRTPLIPAITLKQALGDDEVPGGGRDQITRRRFLKRSGGATVAALVAYNWSITAAQAKNLAASDTKPSRASNHYQIRVNEVSKKVNGNYTITDVSTGGLAHYVYNNVASFVQRILFLGVYAPEDPADNPGGGGPNYAPSATSALSICVWEGARIAPNVDGAPGTWSYIVPDSALWVALYGNEVADKYFANASIKKKIDAQTGEITIVETTVEGDGDETQNGIRITTEWIEDVLTIGWETLSPPVTYQTHKVEPEFVYRNL